MKRIRQTGAKEFRRMMAEEPWLDVSELKAMVRETYVFDYDAMRERELNRFIKQCAHSVTANDGSRVIYFMPDGGKLVNTEVCHDPHLLDPINRMMEDQVKAFKVAQKRLKKRIRKIIGQISMFDVFEKTGT